MTQDCKSVTSSSSPFLIGFVAFSGTGKTTLLCKLLHILQTQGKRVGVIKNTHHDFEIDKPGKDSYELRKAGASQMLLTSRKRSALITESASSDHEPLLKAALTQLDTNNLDLILVEGFKYESYPKIELHRRELNKPYLYKQDNNIIAVATDYITEDEFPIPVLDINNAEEVCDYVLRIAMTGKYAIEQE